MIKWVEWGWSYKNLPQTHILQTFSQIAYGSGHICSGTLISNFTVLTSASCLLKSSGEFYEPGDLQVAIGNVNRMTETAFTFKTEVTAVRPHGRFNRRTLLNNLALLEVFEWFQVLHSNHSRVLLFCSFQTLNLDWPLFPCWLQMTLSATT